MDITKRTSENLRPIFVWLIKITFCIIFIDNSTFSFSPFSNSTATGVVPGLSQLISIPSVLNSVFTKCFELGWLRPISLTATTRNVYSVLDLRLSIVCLTVRESAGILSLCHSVPLYGKYSIIIDVTGLPPSLSPIFQLNVIDVLLDTTVWIIGRSGLAKYQ